VGSWGFIALAYGLAGVALAGYLLSLRGRLRRAAEELAALEQTRRAG